MKVSWPLLITSEMAILFYTVKYYALGTVLRARREVEQDIKLINTTKNLTIDGLHPSFTYNVAVAVNTIIGRGNFSDEITVGLSENSLFQLFFSGAIDCQKWIVHHIDAKLNSARSELSYKIDQFCKCQFSADYIILSKPHCISAHTDWLILWGTILGTNVTDSITILNQLQEWSEMESKVVVEGVHLTALKFCPVSLSKGEPPYCETQALGGSQPVSHVTSVVVGVIMTMLILIFVVLVCLVTVSFYKKKKVRERQLRFHSDHPLHTFDNIPTSSDPAVSKCTKEDTDSFVNETTDSIYETILDSESPYSELPSNPPALPDSVPTNMPPAVTTDLPGAVPMIYDMENPEVLLKDRSQRCPTPVEYMVMKPDSAPPSDVGYATVRGRQIPNQLESTDDYVPMFNEVIADGDELTREALEDDNQVPSSQNSKGASDEAEEK
jgi:hypothetical protein